MQALFLTEDRKTKRSQSFIKKGPLQLLTQAAPSEPGEPVLGRKEKGRKDAHSR